MKTLVVCCVVLFATNMGSGKAQQTTAPVKKAHATAEPAPPVPRATWNDSWQTFSGISQSDFRAMGYDTLTEAQGKKVLTWIFTNRAELSCGRNYGVNDKDELKHIHPFIEAANANTATFVGELRSRLGTIQDVRLTYSDSDSDVVVSVLAMATTTAGGRDAGYVAAVEVLSPCTYSVPSGFAAGTSTFRKEIDTFIDIGPDESSVLSRVAATLDVNDFDPVRKSNASLLRLYQQ